MYNYDEWWWRKDQECVRIAPLKAWDDVINLEFIIYLMMF